MKNSINIYERWNNKAIFRMIWPLIVERVLVAMVGIADTAMVSPLGAYAVSGVSIVDSLNVLFLDLFLALATGGAVVVSQYLGRDDRKNGSLAARQLLYFVAFMSILVMIVLLVFHEQLLHLIYGHMEEDVMEAAGIYFRITVMGYPLLALYHAAAALFRSMGISRVGMSITFIGNIMNLIGNYVMIYVWKWGVAGAAWSTFFTHMASAAVILVLLYVGHRDINIYGIAKIKLNKGIISSILRVALPNSMEGSMFQFGKLALARLASTFGTAAMAGHAIANNIISVGNLPGVAVGMAMLTIVGQCIGAGDHTAARHYVKKLMKIAYAIMSSFNLMMLLILPFLLKLFQLSDESMKVAQLCGSIFCAAAIFIWIPAYCLPNALRAAGDGKYTMLSAGFAMWSARVGIAYLLAYVFHIDIVCVWIAMVCEWVVRGTFFSLRWRSRKWEKKSVIT